MPEVVTLHQNDPTPDPIPVGVHRSLSQPQAYLAPHLGHQSKCLGYTGRSWR